MDSLLNQFDSVIQQFKKNHPQATFVLEYHHSCVNHGDEGFHLFTFTLSMQNSKQDSDNRHYQIITWKTDAQESYGSSEAKVKSFMGKNNIENLPESSGIVSSLDPE